MFNLNNKNMKTVMPETIQTTPQIKSINTMDMVEWWSNNGTFNWMLYRQIIDAKRFLDINNIDKK